MTIPQDGPLAGVSADSITVPVPVTAWHELAATIVRPGSDRVTHSLWVDEHPLAGQWVVTGAKRVSDQGHWITLNKLVDPQ